MYIKPYKKMKGKYKNIKIFTKPLGYLIKDLNEIIRNSESEHLNIVIPKPIWSK